MVVLEGGRHETDGGGCSKWVVRSLTESLTKVFARNYFSKNLCDL